ncbi:hypothetical protein [uncultured Mailhella sp.]|uniref:hypothetical protein n=1 Tax=uncultured Mailhella sp. TaxID=1981031 RepID=UPI0032085C4B
MKVRFLKCACAALLICGLTIPALEAKAGPADLTGKQWTASTTSEKLAFLYGVSSTVAIEQLVADRQKTEPSPFVAAWIKAFGDQNWKQIQKNLDDWYAAHPSDAERPVFDVLWYEFMAPAYKK